MADNGEWPLVWVVFCKKDEEASAVEQAGAMDYELVSRTLGRFATNHTRMTDGKIDGAPTCSESSIGENTVALVFGKKI